MRKSVASLPVRGSSEDAPLHWEGIHSRGVCIESSAISSCTLRTGTPLQNCFPLLRSLSCSHELFATPSLRQHIHLQPAQWLHDRSPEARASSASSTCLQRPCQVSYSWAYSSSHFSCSGQETPADSVHRSGFL